MFRHRRSFQLSTDEFVDNLGKKLKLRNHWVRLADHIPWDDLARIYSETLGKDSADIGSKVENYLRRFGF